jgi:hypothetical protein
VQPEQVHRLQPGLALHHLVERVEVPARDPEGPRTAWVLATNVYVQTGAGLAHGGAPRQPGSLPSRPRTRPPSALH